MLSTKDDVMLAPVSSRDEGVEFIKVFLLPEEKELIKKVCQEEGISMTHLTRQILVQWAKEKSKTS